MKKEAQNNPSARLLALFAAAAAAACLLAGCAAGTQDGAMTTRYQVALVAKSTSTEFWKAVFVGAQAAATEYNMDLTVTGPDTEEDYAAQNEMIRQAVANGAQALVFSAIDYEANAAAIGEAVQAGVPVVVIDSDVNAAGVATYIGTDNYSAGVMAAQAALDAAQGELTVGIVNYDVNSANGQWRERGARETLEASGRVRSIVSINTLAEAGTACTDTLALLQQNPDINVLLALNEPTSVGAARAVQTLALADTVSLVAFDSNLETIKGLETGLVDAMVVQNTYAMGYLGVESAYKLLTGQSGEVEKTVSTVTRTVTRETIFTADGQKTLFPFTE